MRIPDPTRLVLASVVAAVCAAPALGQSLGEVAAKDKERREKQRKASPVPAYTDGDIQPSPQPAPSPLPSAKPPAPAPGAASSTPPVGWKAPRPSPAAAAPPAPGAPAAPAAAPAAVATPDTSAAERAALEAQWRGIARQRRDALAAAEALVVDLKARLDGARNDMTPTAVGAANREQSREAAIAALTEQLNAAEAAVPVARKAVDDLESDAVRAGALPGWVR